jgi:hypothetical protein
MGRIKRVIIPKYVISTKTFESLEDAEAKIKQWHDSDDLTPGTRVFRVVEVFTPQVVTTIKLGYEKTYEYESKSPKKKGRPVKRKK